MDANFWDKVSSIAANSKPSDDPLKEVPYAFTEIISVTFSSPVDLVDPPTTTESQLWSQTIQIYLNHPGITHIWWGQGEDNAQVIKLILDWKSVDDRNAFHAAAGSSLPQIWEKNPNKIATSAPEYYVFPLMQGYRKNAFQTPNSSFKDVRTVFLTFRLPGGWDATEIDQTDELKRPQQVMWDNAWSIFRQEALRSEGAWIADKSLDGWSHAVSTTAQKVSGDEQKSFVGVFRFLDANAAKKFVRSLGDREQKWADGGFEKLKSLAERGMSAEVVNMKVEVSKPDDN